MGLIKPSTGGGGGYAAANLMFPYSETPFAYLRYGEDYMDHVELPATVDFVTGTATDCNGNIIDLGGGFIYEYGMDYVGFQKMSADLNAWTVSVNL